MSAFPISTSKPSTPQGRGDIRRHPGHARPFSTSTRTLRPVPARCAPRRSRRGAGLRPARRRSSPRASSSSASRARPSRCAASLGADSRSAPRSPLGPAPHGPRCHRAELPLSVGEDGSSRRTRRSASDRGRQRGQRCPDRAGASPSADRLARHRSRPGRLLLVCGRALGSSRVRSASAPDASSAGGDARTCGPASRA
jgi:hypothetical protein